MVKSAELAQVVTDAIAQADKSGTFIEVGKAYFFRTVTFHHIGIVRAITPTEILLDNACWVASSARWHETFLSGKLAEVEVLQPEMLVVVHRGAIVDVTYWPHQVPLKSTAT